MALLKNFFIGLSNNSFLNNAAKKVGLRLGANKVAAGNTIPELTNTIEYLNDGNITVTVDNLGEFVGTVEENNHAKEQILTIMDAFHQHGVRAHMPVKSSQLGAEFDLELAYQNLREILLKANTYNNIHINIDTEKYASLQQIVQVLDRLKGEFRNVGTVIQAYLHDSHGLVDKYQDLRLRLVKGAYREDESIAFQFEEDVDTNYIKIIEQRLLNTRNFTPIATYNHRIINHVKQLMKENHIEKGRTEFQIPYGFRSELAEEITSEGYNFIIYVPYGDDRFAYFIGRSAERPQNLSLAAKKFMKPAGLKRVGITAALGATVTLCLSTIKKLCRKQDLAQTIIQESGILISVLGS